MSIPVELSKIIKEKLHDSGDLNVKLRACRQINAYLSVLNQRLDIFKTSENYKIRDYNVIQGLMVLDSLKYE